MKGHGLRAAVSLGLCAALLTGCSLRLPQPDSVPSVALDPLTGQEMVWPGQRPAAVVIENASGNTTQWGIGSASVVLEALTENDEPTSLCLVYPSVGAMPQVGPVAAGQDLYWRLLAGQQAIPIQLGGGRFNQNYLDYYSIRAVDALEAGRNAFSCMDTWSNSPLWYTSGEAVSGVLSSLSISPSVSESRVTSGVSSAAAASSSAADVLQLPPLLPQEAGGRLPDATAHDAVNVRVAFDAKNATGFVYDEASGQYQMLRADSTPQLDANSNQAAAFDNLLILFSGSALRDDGRTFDYDLTMGGGVWLNGGHLWTLTWTQGSDSTFALYDADGKSLTLSAGRSYLALVSSLTGQELQVTDGSGTSLLPAAPSESAGS